VSATSIGRKKTQTIPVDAGPCCDPTVTSPLTEAAAVDLAKAFASLADPIRLRLYSLVASSDEICSCDLMPLLDRSQPTVSHHTKQLADAGLIEGEKRGRWVYWRAVPAARDELRRALGS
jgi:ArsR family transcriptional regulator